MNPPLVVAGQFALSRKGATVYEPHGGHYSLDSFEVSGRGVRVVRRFLFDPAVAGQTGDGGAALFGGGTDFFDPDVHLFHVRDYRTGMRASVADAYGVTIELKPGVTLAVVDHLCLSWHDGWGKRSESTRRGRGCIPTRWVLCDCSPDNPRYEHLVDDRDYLFVTTTTEERR